MPTNTTNSPIVGADGALIGAMGDVTAQDPVALSRTYAGVILDAVEPPADGTANIANGATLAITNSAGADSHNATVAVAGNDITSTKLAATVAMVDNTDTVPVQNSAGAAIGTGTAAVAAGVVSNVKLPATIAGVANNGTVTVSDAKASGAKTSTGTYAVAAGVVSSLKLAATDAIIKNGDSYTTADGGTLAVAIAAGVPTFTYTAP